MFYDLKSIYNNFNFNDYFNNVKDSDILKSIEKEELSHFDFLNLISPNAIKYIEKIAEKSHSLTVQQFGKTISLYLPLYISNYCTNECVYCGFNKNNKIGRKHLNLKEIREEAKEIAKTGIKHILILTGEAEGVVEVSYLEDAVKVLKEYFSSVSIEVYPMEEDEYRKLKEAGVDGLTIYQEVYDEDIYKQVHLSGKKRDYHFRINTPERGAKAGFRVVNIGTLFGLGDLREEAFYSAIHAKYLSDKYINTEFSISLPRINSAEGGFEPLEPLDDIKFIQFMMAYRLYLPKLGINISTRENAFFRNNLLKLGVTKFSAGSKTTVGGYLEDDKTTQQFEISDDRSVEEIVDMLKKSDYQAVFKDWELIS